MKRFSEQFKKKADNIHLDMAEKTDLRERVVSYMEYHPLPGNTKQFTERNFSTEQSTIYFPFNVRRFLHWSGSLVIICALSISFLAEKAVPGDVLYAIKVGFNEELRSTLAVGSYEKVVWETERLNRRIAEARLLADEGRLTIEVEEQVASAVRQHSDNARKEIENLKLTDKDEATMASIELATALDVQTTSLKNRSDDEPEKQTTSLIESVLEQSQATQASSAEENTLPAYERLMAKVESETTRAFELLEGVKKTATEEEQIDIKRRLDDIERKVTAAIGLVVVDETAARNGLVEVLQQTHRLIVFMTNIDVRSSMTVDEIVPLTLTNEERIAAVKKETANTAALLVLVENTLRATSSVDINNDLLRKIEPAMVQSSSSLNNVLTMLATEPIDIEAIEGLSFDAYNLILDSASLLNISVPNPNQEVEVPAVEKVINEELPLLEEDDMTSGSTSSATSTEVEPSV